MNHEIRVSVSGRAANFTDIYKLSTQINSAISKVTDNWKNEGSESDGRRVDRIECHVEHR